MGILNFRTEVQKLINEHGVHGVKYAAENFARGALVRASMTHRAFSGTETLLNEDWDLLLILDACRYDAMKQVEDEYEFLSVSPRISYASSSQDWLQKTFFKPEIALGDRIRTTVSLWRDPYQNDVIADAFEMRDVQDVAYLTANPQSTMLDSSAFAYVDEIWRTEWDDELGQLPPRIVTEKAIEVLRERNDQQTVVHYMQPHGPFRMAADPGHMPWVELQTGTKSRAQVWEEYIDNLRWVLDSVAVLLKNADAETVVVTADHGEQLGTWGVYGHRPYIPFTEMRCVPWVVTSAQDTAEYYPEVSTSTTENDREKLLHDLGYL